MLQRALRGESKKEILLSEPSNDFSQESIRLLAEGHYCTHTAEDISGTGYVVRSLEAALWSFWTTESFEEAILTAANLGDDADTTAAVCGQLAGAHYGALSLPPLWMETLVQSVLISNLADQLMHSSIASGNF